MTVEEPKVSSCCGSPMRVGLLLLAYFKWFSNVLIIGLCVVITWCVLAFRSDERIITALMLSTMAFLIIDVIFTTALIFGAHLKQMDLLNLYYRYGLVCGIFIIALGSLWIVYLLSDMGPDSSPTGIFIIFSSLTASSLLFHIYFVILTRNVIMSIKSNYSDL